VATPSPSAASAADLTTAPVERRTMVTAADLSGSLAYEASRAVAAGSAGIVTRLPAEGAVIERGGVLYELDGHVRPRLLYGARPMWRPLGPKVSDGADVLQLEQNLAAMGYAPKGMKVNRHWDAKTTTAVKRWQRATGRKRDATLDGADLAFLPGAVRVASHGAEVGAAVTPGAPILGATTATRAVTLDLSASRQDLVAPGQTVTIDLPDDSVVPGRVRSIGRVATAGENGAATTVPVTIDIDPGATLPDLDAAPVTVHVVTESHPDVLAVPVNALVALLEGGYAVEVVEPDGTRRYVGVETGLFEDGRVEVAGDGLEAGDLVVVPR
jgi:multidrug efflux pump subunit AcrA (membrane-fusion protein)